MPKETFPELLQAVARRFTVGQSLAGDLAVTGQPYADLSVDVARRDQTYDAGMKLFERYAMNRTGIVYFGAYPSIERVRAGKRSAFRVSLRVLISDNPVVSRLAGEGFAA